MVDIRVKDLSDGVKKLEFELRRPLEPSDLPKIQLPKIMGQGLVISGRGPIWLYGYLIHHYMHLFQFIAVYDPKIGGAVIIASHHPSFKEGEVIY